MDQEKSVQKRKRTTLSRHPTFMEAWNALRSHSVTSLEGTTFQIRRTHDGFKVVRRDPI